MQLHQSPRRTYDHRIREHICRTRNPSLFPELRIPRSTTTSWLRRPLPTVVSCQPQRESVVVLRERIHKLETRARTLAAVLPLQRALLRVSGFSLGRNRLPEGAAKERFLRAVTRARNTLPLLGILRILRLSPQRYHRWMRAEPECGLDDRGILAIPTSPVALYLHMLDSLGSVKRLIAFWVDQHNTVMPHSAFLGQTPDEIYFGTGDHVPAELKAAHRAAQQRRLTENQAARCRLCEPMDAAPMESLPNAETLGFQ